MNAGCLCDTVPKIAACSGAH